MAKAVCQKQLLQGNAENDLQLIVTIDSKMLNSPYSELMAHYRISFGQQ